MNKLQLNRFAPPVTLNLLIINFLIWFAEIVIPNLTNLFGLHYFSAPTFKIYQLLTYMFLHNPNGLDHLLFNMFALWMFGSVVENYWGAKRFLIYYFVCGLSAAFTQELVWYAEISPYLNFPQMDLGVAFLNTIGASGAIFGLLLAYGLLFPNAYVYIFFLLPLKSKYFVILYGLIELFMGVQQGMGSSIAHFAHIGGMLGGIILYLYWRKTGKASRFY